MVLGLSDSDTALSPDALISAILTAPVDLLWNGGIGTYVKASNQSNADVGDRSNDAVRVDAAQLRARVVGEGGNLGLTQEARIEFALAGGLVCTDFIDNSAGVDTSDHEVNIKILLDREVQGRDPDRRWPQRAAPADDRRGRQHVLEHNYQQNRALAAAAAQSAQMLHVHTRYIRKLERDGRIRRRLDVLPGDREIAERRSAGTGLVIPEFSVLLAQTKIAAAQEVLASALPDDRYLRHVLVDYFPTPLRAEVRQPDGRAPAAPRDHHDRGRQRHGGQVRHHLRVPAQRGDRRVGAGDHRGLAGRARRLRHARLLGPGRGAGRQGRHRRADPGHAGRPEADRAGGALAAELPPAAVRRPGDDRLLRRRGADASRASLPTMLTGRDLAGFAERREVYAARGVPADLADRIAAMVPAYSAFDIVDIAHGTGRSVEETAEVYFDLADRLQIARLRDMITALPRDDRWNTMARGAIRDDLYTAHAALARDVLTVTAPASPEQRLAAWVQRNDSAVRRATQTLTEIWESNAFTVATLSVAVRAVRTLVTTATLPT